MKGPEKNWVEWSVFALSSILIAALLAYLVVEATRYEPPLPELRIELGVVLPSSGDFQMPVTVHNAGERTVEELEIEVLLPATGTAHEERAHLCFPYVPRGSDLRGWVHFERDPSDVAPRARILGFTEP